MMVAMTVQGERYLSQFKRLERSVKDSGQAWFVPHRREQALQLPHEIPDEVRISVHGLDGLNRLSFAMSHSFVQKEEGG